MNMPLTLYLHHCTYCTFINNTGKVLVEMGKLSVSMSVFYGNTKGCISVSEASLHIIDSNFTHNMAINGGVLTASRSQVYLDRCSLRYNTAKQDGGAILIRDSSKLVLESSVQFVNNMAGSEGGAVMVLEHSTFLSTQNTFLQNTAGSGGAVMLLDHSSYFAFENTFIQNTAE